MTYEEAYHDMTNYYACGCYNGDNGIDFEVMIKSINALGKQVPVKPVSKYPHRSGRVCPACETEYSCRILLFEKYCPDCGQCVDWG